MKRKLLFLLTIIATFVFIFGCVATTKGPILEKLDGPSGTIYNHSSTFSWSGKDSDGKIVEYQFRKDGKTWTSNGTLTSYTWNNYKEGLHGFEVRAIDNSGNYSNAIGWLFTYIYDTFIYFDKQIGGTSTDKAYSIQQTNDNGYIVAGFTLSKDGDVTNNNGAWDYWVVKLNELGNIEWQKCLGGRGADIAKNIKQTSDGGYVVAGYSNSTNGDITENNGLSDFWIVKLDANGNIDWQKCYGGSDSDTAECVQQTNDDGYIIAGYTYSDDGYVTNSRGWLDAWIIKLDKNGNLVWEKCIGGTGKDYAYSIKQTIDDGFIVAGYTNSNDGDVTGNNGNDDYWIVKLDSFGNIEWQKCYGGTYSERAYSIETTYDGGYIVAGKAGSNDGDVSGNHYWGDYWIVKLDSLGNIEWQKCLGGSYKDYAESAQQTSDGGYIVAGYTLSNDGDVTENNGGWDGWIVKLDNTGEIKWQKSIGDKYDNQFYSIKETTDRGFIIAGYSNIGKSGPIFTEPSNYWIVKLSPK